MISGYMLTINDFLVGMVFVALLSQEKKMPFCLPTPPLVFHCGISSPQLLFWKVPNQTFKGSHTPLFGKGRLCFRLNIWWKGKQMWVEEGLGFLTHSGQGEASGLKEAAILNSTFHIAWSLNCLDLSIPFCLWVISPLFLLSFSFLSPSFWFLLHASFVKSTFSTEFWCIFQNRHCSVLALSTFEEEVILSLLFFLCHNHH